jgi:hypothetical protein
VTGLASNINLAPMFFNNRATDTQSQTTPLPLGFSGKERFKDFSLGNHVNPAIPNSTILLKMIKSDPILAIPNSKMDSPESLAKQAIYNS